jgi:N-acetylmuramoyl-L-alanine amidase
MFAINGQLLVGDSPQGIATRFLPTANHDGQIVPKYLVFHYTACSAAAARAAFLRQTGGNRVSAHLLVDRDGSVTQFLPLNQRAWHAGESRWDGFQDLNTHSIGIEVVNFGYLLKSADGTFRTADGAQTVPAAEVTEGRHRLPHWPWTHWHAYSAEQIATCEALTELLAASYSLRDAVGHDDIAPARKADPGPSFPMSRMRGHILGRDSAQIAERSAYVAVDKLNIRVGPGVASATAGPPLVRNTRLEVLALDSSGWMQVTTRQQTPLTGWVRAEYTADQVT